MQALDTNTSIAGRDQQRIGGISDHGDFGMNKNNAVIAKVVFILYQIYRCRVHLELINYLSCQHLFINMFHHKRDLSISTYLSV